jgi:hypothetical protein
MLADRGFADRYDQRLYRRRMERHLLLRTNIYTERNAELVEELQLFTLRRLGTSRMHNSPHKANQG